MINETVTAIHEALSVRMVAAIWPPSLVKRQLNQAGRHENQGIAEDRFRGPVA